MKIKGLRRRIVEALVGQETINIGWVTDHGQAVAVGDKFDLVAHEFPHRMDFIKRPPARQTLPWGPTQRERLSLQGGTGQPAWPPISAGGVASRVTAERRPLRLSIEQRLAGSPEIVSLRIVTGVMAPITAQNDPRLREYLAVIGFLFGEFYIAAINVSSDGSQEGNWYTTIPDEVSSSSPIGSENVTWSEIARYASQPCIVTSWAHYE